MNAFDPVFVLPLAFVLLVVAIFATIAVVRAVRARRRARNRVVERPNSHYTSQLVRERETRHRWHGIDLDRIHEINREEVARLLAKVEAVGVHALRDDERTFLDYMAELTGTKPAETPRQEGGGVAPELRHDPA